MHVGIAHHLGWAVAVTASGDHRVVDRRRIELVGADLPVAPVHHEGGPHAMHRASDPLDDDDLARLVERVRSSALDTTGAGLDTLAAGLAGRVATISLRAWPDDFPEDVSVQRRVPHESRADSVMYLRVLDELARDRGWEVHRFDAKRVEQDATDRLGDRAEDVLHGPRRELGPPWTKDHRIALAATVLAAGDG